MFGASFSLRFCAALFVLFIITDTLAGWPETEVQGLDPDLRTRHRRACPRLMLLNQHIESELRTVYGLGKSILSPDLRDRLGQMPINVVYTGVCQSRSTSFGVPRVRKCYTAKRNS